jgi:hypothetical protein
MFGANENKAITGDKKLTAEARRMLRKKLTAKAPRKQSLNTLCVLGGFAVKNDSTIQERYAASRLDSASFRLMYAFSSSNVICSVSMLILSRISRIICTASNVLICLLIFIVN